LNNKLIRLLQRTGFAIVGVILASQTRLGKRTGKSIRGYISSNDTRISAFRDLLNNIKSVKAGAIEDVFFRKITAARCAQLESLRCFLATSFAVFMAINQTTPYLAACAAFLAYARSGAKLTSDVVFPCLAYFHLLYQPVTLASLAMSRQFTVRPSLARIKELVNAGESNMMAMESDTANSSPAVSFKSASFAWPSKDGIEAVTLHVGELDIPRGKFTAIIGPNGAGKTSLLQAILGQMCFTKGSCHVYGSVAYCAQDPWVMSGTLLENIIFNSPRGYDAQRYGDVIRSCGLDKDFAKLPGGIKEATIGESGSNLSGGQRSRVSLARALYSDADILLLDDPLSALDAHVRSDLFNTLRCLDKSVILGKATHHRIIFGMLTCTVTLHTSFILQVDHVVVVDDSKIRWAGSQPDLLAQSWVSDYVRHEHSEDAEQEGAVQEAYPRSAVANENSVLSSSGYGDDQDAVDGLWEEEDRARGALQWDVAKFYVRMSGGIAQAGAVIFMVLLLTAAKVISQYWFVWWIGDSIGLSQEQYMGSFLGLTLSQGLVTAGVGLTLVASSLKAARSVHDIILRNLIAAPLWFFQQNPSGRILNRLSRDLEAMDSSITNAVDGLIAASTTMFASVTIVASSGVVVLAAVIPFLVVVGWCLQMFRVYVISALRHIESLESNSLLQDRP
jgi:ATP-binding cassette subfamily C (CFTR/MRP) protein 10